MATAEEPVLPAEVLPEAAITAAATAEAVITEEEATAEAVTTEEAITGVATTEEAIMEEVATTMAEVRTSSLADTSGSLSTPIRTAISVRLLLFLSLHCTSILAAFPSTYDGSTVYVEQEQPYYWYYCRDPEGYYPYVTSCPGGSTTVVPTPPGEEGVKNESATRSSVILSHGDTGRVRNNADGSHRTGDARPGKTL